MHQLTERFTKSYWRNAGYDESALRRIREVYDRFRVYAKVDANGVKMDLPSARRLTLGFDKVLTLIAMANLQPSHCMLNPFGGGGGVARVGALVSPREIVLGDLAYGETALKAFGFRLEVEPGVNNWIEEVRKAGFSIKTPLLEELNWDARHLNKKWTARFNCIVADPPFGNASAVLGISGESGLNALLGFIEHARGYLAPHGRIAIICPEIWVDVVSDTARREMLKIRMLEPIGRTTCGLLLDDD